MQVFVTSRAEQNFEAIIDYLKHKWGENTAAQFVQKADEIFKLLKNFPTMGQVEKDDIRGFQLTKQTRILYRIKGEKIIILAFFDVRQNPNKKLG